MKTSAIEVRDMLSVLSVQGVEERIGEVPGVESVTVNFSAGTATVRYDETRLDISDIKPDVRQRGYTDADNDADADVDADADADADSDADADAGVAAPASPAATPQTAPKTPAGKPAEISSSSPEASAASDSKPPDKTTQTMDAPPLAKAEVPDKTTPDAGEKMLMPEKG